MVRDNIEIQIVSKFEGAAMKTAPCTRVPIHQTDRQTFHYHYEINYSYNTTRLLGNNHYMERGMKEEKKTKAKAGGKAKARGGD